MEPSIDSRRSSVHRGAIQDLLGKRPRSFEGHSGGPEARVNCISDRFDSFPFFPILSHFCFFSFLSFPYPFFYLHTHFTMATTNGTSGNDFTVKAGLAQMLKGGVIMDVVNAEQVRLKN